VFAIGLGYWLVQTFQLSHADVQASTTTITFEEYTAPRSLGTLSTYEYASQGVEFTDDAGSAKGTVSLSKITHPCGNPVVQNPQITSGTNWLNPVPDQGAPLGIHFTNGRVSDQVSFQLLNVGLSKNLVEFFDNNGQLIKQMEYVGTDVCGKTELVSLSAPNIAKIRISQPGSSFTNNGTTGDFIGIDDVMFTELHDPNAPITGKFTVQPESGAVPLQVTATFTPDSESATGASTNYVGMGAAQQSSTSPNLDATTAGAAIHQAQIVWDFGDGAVIKQGSVVETHTYTAPGTYTVSLTINGNLIGTKQVTVSPAKVEPTNATVTLQTSKSVYQLGDSVDLIMKNRGPATIQTVGGLLNYDISQNGQVVFSRISPDTHMGNLDAGNSLTDMWNQQSDAKKQVAAGTYVVRTYYYLNDQKVTKSTSFSIAAATPAPVPHIEVNITPIVGTVPLDIVFTCSGDTVSGVVVDLGDGTVVSDVNCPTRFTHRYATAGNYTISVRKDGNELTTQDITVKEPVVITTNSTQAAVLASTGASLGVILLMALVISGIAGYFILRQPLRKSS